MRGNTLQRLTLLALLAIALLTTGVVSASAQQQAAPPPPSKFKLMSPAYTEGSMLPTQFSCADPNAGSPALQWSNPPAAAMSFAVILHDTDAAPQKGTMDVTHWIFWNIPATSTVVAAGMKPDASPDGIMQGKNVRNMPGFLPPCPPVGGTPHHYIFELYALDAKLDLPAGSARADLLKAMDGHVVGKATYVALFGR
jgi:Raf kinase inhibitor-like YbhB/YbcL family protein